jgi:NADH-quinone oxidoreductase subunit N
MQPELILLLPFMIIAGGGTLIFCLGALRPSRTPGVLFGLAALVCIAAGLAAAFFRPLQSLPSSLLALDDFGRYYVLLFAAITAITLLFSRQYAEKRNFAGDEFSGLVLFACLGMMLVAAAVHWLVFFLGLELLSISLYVLIAMRPDHALATEAAVKYFIPGAVASAFLVFGIAMIYAAQGTLSLQQSLDIAAQNDSRYILLLGLGFVLVGVGFKVSLVPFHLWTPDVYQGAAAPVTAFLATGSKVALFSLLVRLSLYSPESISTAFFPFLWLSAALTMTVGNITALVQGSVKRLLAYSSIAHMGYLVMALLAVRHGGAAAVLFYSGVYAVSDLGAFGALGLMSPLDEDRDRLDDFRGLGYSQPVQAALFALSLFSLAGLPATAGFIGKFVLFQATFAQNLVVLGLIGISTAVISMYYYLKIVVLLYMRSGADTADRPLEKTGATAIAAGLVVALLIVWLGLFPSAMLDMISRIVTG